MLQTIVCPILHPAKAQTKGLYSFKSPPLGQIKSQMWMRIKTVQTKMHNRSRYSKYFLGKKSIDNDEDDDDDVT